MLLHTLIPFYKKSLLLKCLGVIDRIDRAVPEELGQSRVSELNLDRNQIALVPSTLAENKRLRVLRLEEVGTSAFSARSIIKSVSVHRRHRETSI